MWTDPPWDHVQGPPHTTQDLPEKSVLLPLKPDGFLYQGMLHRSPFAQGVCVGENDSCNFGSILEPKYQESASSMNHVHPSLPNSTHVYIYTCIYIYTYVYTHTYIVRICVCILYMYTVCIYLLYKHVIQFTCTYTNIYVVYVAQQQQRPDVISVQPTLRRVGRGSCGFWNDVDGRRWTLLRKCRDTKHRRNPHRQTLRVQSIHKYEVGVSILGIVLSTWILREGIKHPKKLESPHLDAIPQVEDAPRACLPDPDQGDLDTCSI